MTILKFRSRKGSVFTMLMATVGMVGIVSVGAMNLIGGPITTAAKVTHQNMAQNDLLMNAKVVVMNASTRLNMGDEDSDGYIEPVPFTPISHSSCGITLPGEGGCLPGDIGAILTDPWGTQYAYCVWDHGEVTGSANRIAGEDSTSGAVLAIISAGPNKRFETPCSAYDGDPDTNDITINPDGVGDDLLQIFTYAGAVAGSGGLWELKKNEPTTAAINKDIEVGGAFRMGFAGEDEGEVGAASCTQGGHIGRMRFNPFDNAIEVCAFENSLYEWRPMTSGGVKIIDGSDITLFGLAEPEPDACLDGPVGTACADGAIYAGTYGGNRIYAAAANEPTQLSWNNGTMSFVMTSATSLSDGQDNTDILVNLIEEDAPYKAAEACRNKGATWYLPARSEARMLIENKEEIGGFGTSGLWSSTAHSDNHAWHIYSNGDIGHISKNTALAVRCVRR